MDHKWSDACFVLSYAVDLHIHIPLVSFFEGMDSLKLSTLVLPLIGFDRFLQISIKIKQHLRDDLCQPGERPQIQALIIVVTNAPAFLHSP